jgi:uncharacterized membrane protein YfcA
MMLSVLGVTVPGNIHRLNAIKTWLATIINIVASIFFISAGSVQTAPGIALAIGSIIGGYCGATLSLKVSPEIIRYFIIALGFLLTIYFVVKN